MSESTLTASVELLDGMAFQAGTGSGHALVLDATPEVGGAESCRQQRSACTPASGVGPWPGCWPATARVPTAAGLRPVHFDPQRLCPAPGGHPHITALVQLGAPIS